METGEEKTNYLLFCELDVKRVKNAEKFMLFLEDKTQESEVWNSD